MRILSGLTPSSAGIHLGNYFGAVRQWIGLQEENDAYYFIATYHAMTSLKDPAELRQNQVEVALDYLSLGLDPERSVLYLQQDVPEVTELSWILSNLTPMGVLERCHAYKDKVAKGLSADHGLFAYPVLMAADILIVQSEGVPVGQDQKQHVEVTRAILSFTQVPLNVLSAAGVAGMALFGSLALIQVVTKLLFPHLAPPGITTVILVVMFFGALNLFAVSLVGEYIAKIFEEVKQRPHFLRKSIVRDGEVRDAADEERRP